MTCNPRQTELVNDDMPNRGKSEFASVWRYQGKRGVVWRIRYRDATGRRVLETLGREPAWSRALAEKELRRRLVDVERDGYRKPSKATFAEFSERWLTEYLPGRNLKLTTTDGYRQALNRHLLPALGHLSLEKLEREPEQIDRGLARIEAGARIGDHLDEVRNGRDVECAHLVFHVVRHQR